MSNVDYKKRWRERNPEKVREENKRRNPYKRAWAEGECSECGGRIADYRRSEVCLDCRLDESERKFKAKARRFIELREEGLSNVEIESLEGLPDNTVAVHLYRAKKRYGIDVPRSPYFKAPA